MMKEFKIEEIMPLEAVKSKIWMMFDILRSENISSDDYHVVLFLLSAFKDNLISTDLINENHHIKERLIERLRNSNYESNEQYAPIIQSFEPSIQRLSENGIRHLFNVLVEINKQVLTENFPDVFDSVLYRISQSQGRYAGEFIQPVELTRFMCGLADLKKDAKVFNPFAGLASFGVYLDQGQDYFGQELNQKTWALGALRLMAYERPGSSRYVCDDSILHWPHESEKFDLILSNPPFGMRLGHYYRDIEPNIRTIEQFLIEKGVQSLKQDGKLIALLPQGFLFRGMQEQRLREHLVEEDLIDTIVSLPGGLLLNTGIPLIILVLDRNKKLPGRVKFVDAKNFVIAKGPREKVLNDYSLNSFIRSDKEDENVVKIVYNEQIRDNDYNLSVARYFQKQIDGVKLGDILELVRGQRGNLPEAGKLIRIRDLKDDKVDFTLDVSSVEETELRLPDIHLVSESCLLLAMRWRTLKPTIFEFKGKPIFRSQDILTFKVNEAIADKAYLINELHADYVQEQLESYRLGVSVMPFIRRDDLMEVVIKLPSIEEQRAKVQGIYELSGKIKSLQEERNALAHGKTLKQFSEFASLKHTLGRPRQNILDWSDNLLDFLSKKKEGFEALNKAFSEFYDIDIISALKEIKRDVNFITDVLEKGENGLVLSGYEKQVIPLSDINSIINELSNNGFNFKIKKLLLKGEKLKERGIYANKTLFKTLLDNILTNANKYAFDKKATGNEVVIELTEVDDSLSMEIRNNGKPFPRNFDREKFITKYSTADSSNGSGLGGYDIHRIASDFNNPDWILSLNEDPFFLVKFKFQFPIKLIN
ncbi:MAG: N-6 DNA methylase [Bacteroidetes bacterium]|nr:N-6 DNA methylase [Bacteroidota bacterium]